MGEVQPAISASIPARALEDCIEIKGFLVMDVWLPSRRLRSVMSEAAATTAAAVSVSSSQSSSHEATQPCVLSVAVGQRKLT